MTSYFVAGIYAWDKVVRGAEIRQRGTGAVPAHYSQGKLFPGSHGVQGEGDGEEARGRSVPKFLLDSNIVY